jgi:glycerophosphoryl diester phosphodiesterase
MHLVDSINRPAVIGHRGASAHAPENTLAAFRLALEHGADGIELDAMLTADGQVVVIHDDTVNRTTGAQGKVRELTLSQIKKLDAGSSFDVSFQGEPVPTLEEVFLSVGADLLVNIELKNYASPGDALPDKVADLVLKYDLQEHILFSSFHPLTLYRIRRRLPNVPVGALTLPGAPGQILRGWAGRKLTPKFIHPYYRDVTGPWLDAEHHRGRRVNVWTVDDPDEMKRLFKMGIDGIITDDPQLARRVLEER